MLTPSGTVWAFAFAALAFPLTGLRQASSGVPLLPPGLHTRTVTRDGAPPIGYALMVPAGYTREVAVPLVLALHFGGGPPFASAGRDLIRLLVGPALAELGSLILAPDALEAGWGSSTNEDAVMWLLDRVATQYGVDSRRVAVTGFSMGGVGAWHYAGRYPDRFSAAIPVAGRPPALLSPQWRAPTLAVHSRLDTVMPVEPTARRIDEMKQAGLDAELVVLDGPSHFQTSGHVDGLTRAVPWLRAIWER